MQMRLVDIQQHVGGELFGDANTLVGAVNSLELAISEEIAFAESDKYLAVAKQSKAMLRLSLYRKASPNWTVKIY
jgi:UDP-3-O-[3-hydroxymyristoyl] glucosamine N-acyltransferase